MGARAFVDGGTLDELITMTGAFLNVDSTREINPFLRKTRPWEPHLVSMKPELEPTMVSAVPVLTPAKATGILADSLFSSVLSKPALDWAELGPGRPLWGLADSHGEPPTWLAVRQIIKTEAWSRVFFEDGQSQLGRM